MIDAADMTRWVSGGGLLLVGGLISIGNWVTLFGIIIKKISASFVLFIGGILAAIGMSILPIEGIWKLSWIPLFADFGTIPVWIWYFYDRSREKPNQIKNPETEQDAP
jgi:hypothetical protein